MTVHSGYGAAFPESWPGLSWLVPAIHVFQLKARKKDVDARDERGHDAGGVIPPHRNALLAVRVRCNAAEHGDDYQYQKT